ncbi:MAG: hypothetical protein QM788_16580 [Roseateles sp.]|uniref:hypothetical protein n=1 Tax=Roseateles sp. TaxID=1971397 RepID=UPI0039E9FB46
MGEARHRAIARRGEAGQAEQAQVVDTLGGRMHVRWDEAASATPHGQLAFFAQFLAATGVGDLRIFGLPKWRQAGRCQGELAT